MPAKAVDIVSYCNKNNIKITALREQLIEILAKADHPCTAYQILSELKNVKKNAEPMTVYRVLDFLVKNNIVHKLEASRKYALCCHPSEKSCQIFVCKKCGKKQECHNTSIAKVLEQISEKSNFRLVSKDIEIYGLCQNCSF